MGKTRDRDRGAGALLMLSLLLALAGGAARLVPDGWPGAEVARLSETFAPALLLASLVLAAAAALLGARRPALVLAAACLLGAAGLLGTQLRQSLPLLPATAARPEGQLRVLFFNVLYSNTAHAEAIVTRVLAEDPDVVIFAEAGGVAPALDRLRAHYPHELICSRKPCSLVAFARPRPQAVEFRSLGVLAEQSFLRAGFRLPGGETGAESGAGAGQEVVLAAVHMRKPWFSGYAEHERARLAALLGPRGVPLLLVGDFNAPAWTRSLAGLRRATGLHSLRWPPPSWPAGRTGIGVPLDHALVRDGMRLLSLQTLGRDLGSNHLGLMARVQVE